MKNPERSIFKLASGDIVVWVDPAGGIYIKTVEPHGDPVELGEQEALDLARLLTQLVAEQR